MNGEEAIMRSVTRLCVVGVVLAGAPLEASRWRPAAEWGAAVPCRGTSAPMFDPVAEYRSGMTAYQAGKYKDAARSF